MTGRELITKVYTTQPHLKLAVSKNDGSIGSWSDTHGRYIVVAGRMIHTNEWYSMEHELLINGEPIPVEWIPVPLEVSK